MKRDLEAMKKVVDEAGRCELCGSRRGLEAHHIIPISAGGDNSEENFMGQLVKVKKSADWAALKKVCSVTPDGEHVATDEGEIIPGVTVTQRPDVFKVEMEDEA